MSDTAGHGTPQHDSDGLRHTMSLKEAEAQLSAAGVPRSHRHIVRLCKSGAFEAAKRPGGSGDEWFIAPQSVPKVIGDLRAIEEARARHSQPRHAASAHVAAEKSNDGNPDTAGHGTPQHGTSDPKNKEDEGASQPDTSRYVALLERDNEFLREQVGKKDEQISDLSKRFSETQILLGAMQKMLAPMLGQADPFRSPESREVQDGQRS
jgi:alkanesulfonate monooxygenase SsuD/methylene tetrahydromethanopterin reductase-like flavin-dependent oxidoreductase (luciferase family)